MATNKVVYNGNTLIDLTGDTLSDPSQLAEGVTAHDRSGTVITGTNSGGSSDMVVYQATVNIARATSGTQVFVPQTTLVAQGVCDSGKTIAATWNNFIVEISASTSNFTHAQKQVVWAEARSCNEFVYNTSYTTRLYKRVTSYHNTNTTAASTGHNYSSITTSTTGYISTSTTNGIFITASSTYGIGGGDYDVTIVCWGHK